MPRMDGLQLLDVGLRNRGPCGGGHEKGRLRLHQQAFQAG
jgi:hypothetical protein